MAPKQKNAGKRREEGDVDVSTPDLKKHPYYAKSKNVEWDHTKVIGPVKDQQDCSSCIPHALCKQCSAIYVINNPNEPRPDLAEQMMVDCNITAGEFDQKGCQNTTLERGYRFFKKEGVLETSVYGTYVGKRCICKAPKGRRITITNQVIDIPKGDVKAILRERPLVAIVINYQEFTAFTGLGIYEPPAGAKKVVTREDDNGPLDLHAVVVLDWGVEDGKEFYLIENSWGYTWGSAGRARVSPDSLHLFSYPVGVQFIQ